MFDWLRNKSKDEQEPLTITHDVAELPQGIRVLRLHCSGYYPPGCNGASHARQIFDTGAKAFLATDADAVLLDFTGLDYVWGDDLCMALGNGVRETGETGSGCNWLTK